MRVIRGSGLYGLRAILPRRSMEGIIVVRPLLDVDRRDVEDYLRVRKTPFCTDTTNLQKVYERNKVRLGLMPLLAREYNPKIISALSDLAATAGEDYEFLSMHARRQFEKYAIVAKRKVKMDLKGIGRQCPAIVRLMFRQMAETLTGDPAVLSFDHIHVLENLAAQGGEGSVDLSHHLKAAKTSKFLELSIHSRAL
jgi:tRNA(Ile)-lysidine synthase